MDILRKGFVVTLAGLGLATGACKKDEKSENKDDTTKASTLAISGSVGTALRLASNADKVVAIPFKPDGQVWEIMTALVEADIGEDGAFRVPFETTAAESYVLALVDSSKGQSIEAIQGIVGMTSGEDSLAKMPTSDAVSDLDLGTISTGAEEITSSKTVADNASAIDEKQEVLEEIAKTDNTIKHVVNAYANNHDDGTNWTSKPFIAFSGALQEVDGQFIDPAKVTYNGYGLYMGARTDKASFETICDASQSGHVVMELTPPTPVTVTSVQGGNPPTTSTTSYAVLTNKDAGPVDTSGSSPNCGSTGSAEGTFYASDFEGSDAGNGKHDLNWNWGGGGFTGKMPAGVWMLKMGGEEVAKFDMASAHPLDENDKPHVYVPSVKLTKNGSGIITQADVVFHFWDKVSASFKEVTDLTALQKQASQITFELTDYSGGCGGSGRKEVSKRFDAPTSGHTYSVTGLESDGFNMATQATAWDANTCVGESVVVTYQMNGASLRFDYRWQWN